MGLVFSLVVGYAGAFGFFQIDIASPGRRNGVCSF